jgi:RNA-directed DNA polymerase
MTKTPISLQDLRKRIYATAKADKHHRFWGLYVHICKEETLKEAYRLTKRNNGAPGIDGVTFEMIEREGLDAFLAGIGEELLSEKYWPMRNRKKEIPSNGKMRTLGIPCIRDRVVEGALKLILEPIFEADFQEGSYGYRPGKKAHEAVHRVARAVVWGKTLVIDLDLSAYFDSITQSTLLAKVAGRVLDGKVLRLLKLLLAANGKRGVPQGGVISPLLANIYLNEVDTMLEKLKAQTGRTGTAHMEYARYADDLVVLVDGYGTKWEWLLKEAYRRLLEELARIDVKVNTEKTRLVDLAKGETFSFLGFDFRRDKTRSGRWGVRMTPRMKARTKLLQNLKDVFRSHVSQPVDRVIALINPKLRGWANYFRIGQASRCFSYVRYWVERKVRRLFQRARNRSGFGWNRWSTEWLYKDLGLYNDYKVRYYRPESAARR